jgi:peptidoglycan/xylan/chitin deacetylase (PgdA/CDA1 family)
VFDVFFPAISLSERGIFLEALGSEAGVDERAMAKDAQLYLTSKHLFELRAFDIEIGNHTYSHTHCRVLSAKDVASEVDQNKAELEAMSGTKVRCFSPPYGSAIDATPALCAHLKATGHQAVFLSESLANPQKPDFFHLDRVNPRTANERSLFLELELLPRLRARRNRLRRYLTKDLSVDLSHQSFEERTNLVGDSEASDRREMRA